ncbi:hypothetical protein [Rhizobium sp. Root482]|uniref:hypothetical protein n=1 Tax=Rhizobium sp. Root482 TaxID=1736543 RepID=UPI0006FCD378|nr:hypothetical protein [Rhizobium sp. Root482]KQY27176.1 hypothetical protein ASD31_03045 [Rhizobium sp. Root482]
MALKSLRVLCQVDLPSGTLRWYDGSGGPFVDSDGEIYRSCVLTEDALDQIELAINAEAFTLSLVISGIDGPTSDQIWIDYKAGTIKGARFRIMIQKCDEYEQPIGAPTIKFTGKIDNLIFGDSASDTEIRSIITVEVTNRFALRKQSNGGVLSDTNQRARSAVLNPTAPPDRFAERVIIYLNKAIRWPKW